MLGPMLGFGKWTENTTCNNAYFLHVISMATQISIANNITEGPQILYLLYIFLACLIPSFCKTHPIIAEETEAPQSLPPAELNDNVAHFTSFLKYILS
jgi:hypothetical protein